MNAASKTSAPVVAVQAAKGKPARKQVSRWKRWTSRAVRFALASVLLVVLGIVSFELVVRFWAYPSGIERVPPAATWLMDRDGSPLAAVAASDGRWQLPLTEGQISPHLMSALIAVEDARFESHNGVDWAGVFGAARDNLFGFRWKRGGSTLTMQLHRLRDPKPRSLLAKLEQAIRARQIEQQLSKQQILVEYINRAPFGGNLVGAGAASWRYFGKPCANLSLGEAAMLAGLPQAPNAFRPDRHPQAASSRRHHVLLRMMAQGAITSQQLAEADAEPIVAAWRPLPQERTNNLPAADGAMPTFLKLVSSQRHGEVITTFDRRIQSVACDMARQQVRSLEASGVTSAAVVVLRTQSAECLAAVTLMPPVNASAFAGLDLTQSKRSTGSVLKPFIYAAAFDAGIAEPSTMLHDEPAAWPAYVPSNYDHLFLGDIPAGEALARSRNIPALTMLERVGVARAIGVMEAAGLSHLARSPRAMGLSLAIGGAEATPMEIAQAYATLARQGVPQKATLVSALPAQAGTQHAPGANETAAGGAAVRPKSITGDASVETVAPAACLRQIACLQTLAALASADRTRSVCAEAVATNVAWKTGTSSGHRDAWCAAVTPNVTVVVWIGNAAGGGSTVLVGQDAAAPLALRLVAAIDDRPSAWEAIPHDTSPAPQTLTARAATDASTGARRKLAIVSPIAGADVVLSPELSADQQRIPLQVVWREAAGSGQVNDDAPVWWFVDGQRAGAGRVRDRLWWTPTAGTHEVRVVDTDGRAATTTVRVE